MHLECLCSKKGLLKGKLPQRKSPYKVKVSMHNPKDFFNESIRKMMTLLNIKELNNSFELNAITDTLLVYQSPELSELIKISQF